MPSPALISVLRSGRPDFNARFAAARRRYPELDPAAFGGFLTTAVDDLAQAVEKVRPDRLTEVTVAAYEAALELVGQKLAGPGARLAAVEEGWRRILPAAAALVAVAPGRLIPAVCNAIHQLASVPNTRPAGWIEKMAQLGPQCPDVEAFLKLGQVCAWRAGLAHFRAGALAAAAGLPEAVAGAALGAPAGSSWASLRDPLQASPWFEPGVTPAFPVRAVARIGAFKGLGGLFIEPPAVAAAGEQFLVRSDSECWVLMADVFGATFHRASLAEFAAARQGTSLPAGLEIAGSRCVYEGLRLEFPALGEIATAAANPTTLALTFRLTHAIVLVALK